MAQRNLDLLALLVSALSLVVSIYVFQTQQNLSKRSFKHAAEALNTEALLDLDKIYIEHPELWAIYDAHPIAGELEPSVHREAQLEALVYYYLNLFEAAHDHHERSRELGETDERYIWDAWDKWMRNFFAKSSRGREVWADARDSYNARFAAYVDSIQPKTVLK